MGQGAQDQLASRSQQPKEKNPFARELHYGEHYAEALESIASLRAQQPDHLGALTLAYLTNWIQDCTLLSSGDLLQNDVGRSRLVQFAGPPWRAVSISPYRELWRGARVLEVPPAYQHGLRCAAGPATAAAR